MTLVMWIRKINTTPILIFVFSYLISNLVMQILRINYISQIDLNLFSLILSLLITFSMAIIMSTADPKPQPLRIEFSAKTNLLLRILPLLIICVLTVIANVLYEGNRFVAFQSWIDVSPALICISIILLGNLVYAPSYILGRTLLRRSKWSSSEKLVFYPVLSALILGSLNAIDAYFRIEILVPSLIILLLDGALIVIFFNDYRSKKRSYPSPVAASCNFVELLGVALVITFNLYIFCWVVGANDAFLRGDMWGDAHRVAIMNNQSLESYFKSPEGGYPFFYSLFWSALSKLLPLPYVNTVILIAFFDIVFSVMTFYVLARLLLGSVRSGLLATIVWTGFTGFFWLFFVLNPPVAPISGNDLLNYIYALSGHVGIFSGGIYSPAYNDDHALTRLWSLSIYFVLLIALVRLSLRKNGKGYLLLFSVCLLQILLGHFSEVPLIALALMIAILMKPQTLPHRGTLLSSLLPSLVYLFLMILLGTFDLVLVLIAFTPFLLAVSAFGSRRLISKYRSSYNRLTSRNMKRFLIKGAIYVFVYVYGLMLIAFVIKYLPVWILYPIFTVWYFPAIEWGFLGLSAALAIFILRNRKLSNGLKFILSLFSTQLILLIVLNLFNYNFLYLITPYPFEPFLFYPVLALIGSMVFVSISSFRSRNHRRILNLMLVTVVVSSFVLGSLDHVISASYWRTNDGWWLNQPLNASTDDFQLMNFLYGTKTGSSSYEIVGTLHDFTDPNSYVIYPSGMSVLSPPLIDILWSASDSREVYLLTHTFHMNYVLLAASDELPSQSYITNILKEIHPIFSNSKYELYRISDMNLTPTELPSFSTLFVTADRIDFDGVISFPDDLNNSIQLTSSGKIYSLGNGKVLIEENAGGNSSTGFIVATPNISIEGFVTLMNMKSTWGYFDDIDCAADQLTFHGNVIFHVFNSFDSRMYMERFRYSGTYTALPTPDWLRPDNAKQLIESYLYWNDINPLYVVLNPLGITWTTVFIILLVVLAWTAIKMSLKKIRTKVEAR